MAMGVKKVSDEVIVESYIKHGNVWLVGKEVGLCGQSVHERLTRLGVIKKLNVFTESEKNILLSEYVEARDKGSLDGLALKLGRTKQFICRKAKALGLTDLAHHKKYNEIEGSNPYARNHARVRAAKGTPRECEVCGMREYNEWYEWANLSGDYENIDDYKRMCRKCHRAHDKGRKMLAHL